MTISRANIVLIATLLVLATSVSATEYIVGDGSGWTLDFDYQAWAQGKQLFVGDKLVSDYPAGKHDVLRVNGTDFQKYTLSFPNGILISGNDVITVSNPGRKWYICGVGKHFELRNMKLVINVELMSPVPSPSTTSGTHTLSTTQSDSLAVAFMEIAKNLQLDIMHSNTPFDSILKVAAIASMCVQPEVSHRSFMGEVVQSMKLVCNEFDEIREMTSKSYNRDDDLDFELMDQSESHHHEMSGYDSKIGLSATDIRSTVEKVEGLEYESFRRQSNSALLKMGKRKQFWKRLKVLSRGSMSDHEHEHRFSSNS